MEKGHLGSWVLTVIYFGPQVTRITLTKPIPNMERSSVNKEKEYQSCHTPGEVTDWSCMDGHISCEIKHEVDKELSA
jgi:hypothetical protein